MHDHSRRTQTGFRLLCTSALYNLFLCYVFNKTLLTTSLSRLIFMLRLKLTGLAYMCVYMQEKLSMEMTVL